MIKAIETRYKGFHFRSRTEARWAVFFDACGLDFEYEKEGYELPSGRYLPDFYLPAWKCFVEIKGDVPTREEDKKCMESRSKSNLPVILINGQPGSEGMTIFCWNCTNSGGGEAEISHDNYAMCRFMLALDDKYEVTICIGCNKSDGTTWMDGNYWPIPFVRYDALFPPRVAYETSRSERFSAGSRSLSKQELDDIFKKFKN